MKAGSPIASSPIWPEAPALQAAQPSGLGRTQPPTPGGTVAGHRLVTDRPVKGRPPRRGHPDREPGLKRGDFGRGAGWRAGWVLAELVVVAVVLLMRLLGARVG